MSVLVYDITYGGAAVRITVPDTWTRDLRIKEAVAILDLAHGRSAADEARTLVGVAEARISTLEARIDRALACLVEGRVDGAKGALLGRPWVPAPPMPK